MRLFSTGLAAALIFLQPTVSLAACRRGGYCALCSGNVCHDTVDDICRHHPGRSGPGYSCPGRADRSSSVSGFSGGPPEAQMIYMAGQAIVGIMELFKSRSPRPARLAPPPRDTTLDTPAESTAAEPAVEERVIVKAVANPRYAEFERLVAKNRLSEEEHRRLLVEKAPSRSDLREVKGLERLQMSRCIMKSARDAGQEEDALETALALTDGTGYAVGKSDCPRLDSKAFVPPTTLYEKQLKMMQKFELAIPALEKEAQKSERIAKEDKDTLDVVRKDAEEFEGLRDQARSLEDRRHYDDLARQTREKEEECRKHKEAKEERARQSREKAKEFEKGKRDAQKCIDDAADEDAYNGCLRQYDLKGVQL